MDPMMNMMYLQQAQSYLQNNPNNVQAQRQVSYWTEVVQRQGAAQQTQPAAPTGAPASWQQGPGVPLMPAAAAPSSIPQPMGPMATASFGPTGQTCFH